jgi:transposase
VTLLMNTLQKTLTSGKAAKGSLPKWSSILLHNERMPNFTKFFPIPFSKANAELAVDGDVYTVTMKTWRVPVEGKSTQVCIADAIKLRMTGRSAKRHLAEFHNIFTGEWRFMGSELEYDDNRRKWFVNLCYQAPSKIADVDSGKVAYLVCGRRIPFYVRTSDGKRYWLQGRGNHIIATRERVWKKRVELNYGSKKTTSMQSGHGRNAAMRWRARWAKTWTSFVKRVNHHVSKDAVDFCVANGIGRIVYCKPNGRYAERRMVSGDFKNSTWQFHDLGTKLAYKCQDRGVTLETKEFGSGDASGEVCTKTTGSLAKSKAKNATKFKRKPKSGNDS